MHGLSLAFGPRTSRRNIKRWSGPRDKDSCSKREKSKRNNGRTTFWTTLSGKLSKGIEGEYIRRSLERGKRWRRFVHFPRRAKSGTFRVLITPRESRLPPSHPRDHCIPYRAVRPFRFSERVRNGKASIPSTSFHPSVQPPPTFTNRRRSFRSVDRGFRNGDREERERERGTDEGKDARRIKGKEKF